MFKNKFLFTDPNEKYLDLMEKRKYENAFIILHQQHISGSVGLQANHFKNFHEILILSGVSNKQASEVRQAMISLMRENIDVDADEIKEFADELQHSLKFLDAMLFYFVAVAFYRSSLSSKTWKILDRCVFMATQCIDGFLVIETSVIEGMKKSHDAMIEASDNLKSSVEHQLIPMIKEMKEMVRDTDGTMEQQKCLYDSWCAHRIEHCQDLVKDHDGRINTINEAISALRKCFGYKYREYQVVGILLSNLGHSYSCLSQFEPAERYYQHAITAYKKAKDYSSPKKKADDIEASLNNLKVVQTMLH